MRELVSVERTVKLAILGLERYVSRTGEGLLIGSRGVDGDYEQHLRMIESVKEFKESWKNKRINMLKQKQIHGQFFNQTGKVPGEENGYG